MIRTHAETTHLVLVHFFNNAYCLWRIIRTSGKGAALEESKAELPDVPVRFQRFEQDLFRFSKKLTQDTLKMYQKYGSFFDLYTSQVIRIGNKHLPLFRENLLGFIQDPDIRSVKAETDRLFSNADTIKSEISTAFNRYHKAFPDSVIPAVSTLISGFNYNVVVSDSNLAIGLDMYLGKNCKFYELLSLPKYKVSENESNHDCS